MNPDQLIVTLGDRIEALFAGTPWLAALVGMILACVPIVLVFAGLFAFTTWLERKGLARIQNRPGPNRTGPFGLLQPMADGIKMLLKEDLTPRNADKFSHFLAPVLMVIPAFTALAFVPLGRNLQAVAIDSALLFFFALGSLATLSVFLAGWSSRNTYSLLGGMRAVAQMVSYEMPLLLAGIGVVMVAGTLSTSAIVEAQAVAAWTLSDNWGLQILGHIAGWNLFTPWGLAGFILFFIAMLAEANRSPFDLPEADSEIIAGHLTEYSGFKYALFFIGEYVAMFAIAGIAVTLFLGGWHGPNIRPWWTDEPAALLIPGTVWFFVKLLALVAIMIWIRGTFPRLRVDQLMGFAWKYLLPLALVNLFVAGLDYHAPWWISWPVGLGILIGTAALLRRVHRGPVKVEQRTYTYAT